MFFFIYLQLTNALVNLVVEENLSYRIVDSNGLKNLLELVAKRRVQLPSRGLFMKTLSQNYDKMKVAMINTFKKQMHMCITCDVWSTKADSFLGMTIHFLTESFERRSFALAFRPLKTKQTNDKLAFEINKVLSEFELTKEQLTNMITDGGSAFTKGSKIYGKEDPLTSHQTIEEIPLEDDVDMNDVLPFMQNEDGEIFLSNTITLHANNLDINTEDVEYMNILKNVSLASKNE